MLSSTPFRIIARAGFAVVAGLAWLLAGYGIDAHPYASGVTNRSGTITWVLNEPATNVKLLFDNGSVTNDLGAAPLVGTNSFSLGTHTNFAIVVYKLGANTLTQISSDYNPNNNFYGARGVAVNKNPKTQNFGRIYVANANGAAANLRATTTRGIYVMDAASEDILGLGNTAATAGISLGTSTTYSPYRLFVGPDDMLYVGDASTGTIGGVWMCNPDCTTSTSIFSRTAPSTTSTNFGRVVGTPNVSGSLAAGTLVLTALMWDTVVGASQNGFNQIYRYNIGSGPLPWKTTPTVVTNPIAIGNANGVILDAEIAPDGKYFITAYRGSPADGTTNLCVLNSAGTAVLWDSRTQSAAYFGDAVNDHLSFLDRSVAVSPDGKFVLIQSQINNDFMLMSLTNGIPDISTLSTNTTVGSGGGTTCHSSTFDAADNIYVTSGGSDTLRIFSLGYTSTCITSNDITSTNGSFQLTLLSPDTPVILVQPTNQATYCGGNATFSVGATGKALSYQWYLGATKLTGATNATLSLSNVALAAAGSYQVAITNSLTNVTSAVATLTVTDTNVPLVVLSGAAATNIIKGTPFVDPGASASDPCAGTLAVTTNGTVNINVVGSYVLSYSATNPSGLSATNTRTVNVINTNGVPVVAQPPAPQIVQCGASATLTVVAGGAAPLGYRWYFGSTPLNDGGAIAGSATASLTVNPFSQLQAGAYQVVITNTTGSVTSPAASLTLTDTVPPVVTLNGSSVMNITLGGVFSDPGATAFDTCAGSLAVITTGSVNVNSVGTYTLTYTATDAYSNTGSATRLVRVVPAVGTITASTNSIVPLPQTVQTAPGVFSLCPAQSYPPVAGHALTRILADSPSLPNAQYLAALLSQSTGYQFQVATNNSGAAIRNAILLTTVSNNATLGAEGYELTVAPDSVVIRAPAQAGVFYGVQSFLQLLPPQALAHQPVPGVAWTAPCVFIQDKPRFPWRGLMLDVARHFYTKQEVMKVLDAMALYKLNTFHWHLVDDQGWRIQIMAYPLLTQVGAWRNGIDFGLDPAAGAAPNASGQYGGYYTQSDIQDVVAYAQQRYITIVPEIEMPAHCSAGLAAYPQFGCGNASVLYNMDTVNYGVSLYSLAPASITFFQQVLTEVMQLFPGQYIHCGGDEVVATGDTQWTTYAPDAAQMTSLGISTSGGTASIIAYQHWFSTNMAAFLQAHGRSMMGWTEFEAGGIVTNAALMDWEIGTSSQATNAAVAGQKVVLAPDASCYFNYYETTNLALEPYFIVGQAPAYNALSNIYAFEPVPTGLAAQYTTNILGAQATLFTEWVPSALNVQYKLFPRLCALAELVWTPAAAKNFTSFTNRLSVQQQRLAQAGINYNRGTVPAIGTWSGVVSTTPATLSFNITPNLTAPGEVDINFQVASGAGGLLINSVSLLQNGVPVDVASHAGLATKFYTDYDNMGLPTYVLHLNSYQPGATYTVQASVVGIGTTASSGTVYLTNWN